MLVTNTVCSLSWERFSSIIVNKNPTIVTFCYICYKRLAQSLANDEVLLGLIIGFLIRSTGNKTSRQFILFVLFIPSHRLQPGFHWDILVQTSNMGIGAFHLANEFFFFKLVVS